MIIAIPRWHITVPGFWPDQVYLMLWINGLEV